MPVSAEITNKQFNKEIEGIYKADSKDIASFKREDLPAEKVALYIAEIKWDLYLLHRAINKYKHHQCTRAEVDAVLAQLDRDLENAP